MIDAYEGQLEELSRLSAKLALSDDVLAGLDDLLAQVIELTGQGSGWIFLRDEAAVNGGKDNGYYLASQYGLPPEIDVADIGVWQGECQCQDLCKNIAKDEVYRILSCDRFSDDCVKLPAFCNHISVPLRSKERVFGTLNVVATGGKPASQRAANILALVSAQLGMALDQRRLAAQLGERRVPEQAVLLAFSSRLLSHSSLEDLMSYLVEEIVRSFQVDACSLLLPDEHSDLLIFRATAVWHSDPVVERRRVSSSVQSSASNVMRTQVPILSESSVDRSDLTEMTQNWLQDEGLEGLVIVPLVVEGRSIGALAMRTPRQFDEDEVRFLQVLANQAGVAIENAALHKEEIRLQSLESELAVGRSIQHTLLPASSPVAAGWQFSDIYRPAREVGGDLYDYFDLPFGQDRLGLVIGDVADKGVPAGLFMAVSRTLIRSVALAGLTPASALTEANRLILQDSATDLFLSAFYAILDTKNGSMSFANAGHNPPLWFRQATGEILSLSAEGIVLCVLEDIKLEEKSINVASGDILILYTDGLIEAMDAKYEEFGLQRLKQVVAKNSEKSAGQILEAIVESVDSFIGETERSDDLTLIVAKRL